MGAKRKKRPRPHRLTTSFRAAIRPRSHTYRRKSPVRRQWPGFPNALSRTRHRTVSHESRHANEEIGAARSAVSFGCPRKKRPGGVRNGSHVARRTARECQTRPSDHTIQTCSLTTPPLSHRADNSAVRPRDTDRTANGERLVTRRARSLDCRTGPRESCRRGAGSPESKRPPRSSCRGVLVRDCASRRAPVRFVNPSRWPGCLACDVIHD